MSRRALGGAVFSRGDVDEVGVAHGRQEGAYERHGCEWVRGERLLNTNVRKPAVAGRDGEEQRLRRGSPLGDDDDVLRS